MFKLKRSSQIVFITAALLSGILLGRAGAGVAWPVWAVLGIISIVGAYKKSRLAFWLLLATALVFGVWRGNTTILAKTWLGQHLYHKVAMTGRIVDDPAVNAKNQTQFTLGSISLSGHHIPQHVKVTTGYKELKRGYAVRVTGKLRPALGSSPVETFGTVAVGSTDVGWVERLRQNFFAAMHTALPDPLSGFALGLLVGVRALISKPLQDVLAAVGLSHLIAVSGYNLTIIIRAAQRSLQKVSIFLATAVSFWLIFGFMLVAGFGASIVRAAMVASLSLLAAYYGRPIKPMVLVALPAAITAAWNPDYLTRDVGWQLSFLAFFGIIVMAPMVLERLGRASAVKQVVVESLCAQLMTMPLIALVFGQLSVVSPIANALVLPLVPLAMLLSFAVGLVAMAAPAMAGWVALPAVGLLGLMLAIIQWLNSWPHASLQLGLGTLAVILIYGSLLLLSLALWRRGRTLQSPAKKATLLPD